MDSTVLLALAAGLGALLALDRRDLKGDVCACLLLCLGARHLFRCAPIRGRRRRADPDREDRWRRAWVFLVPGGALRGMVPLVSKPGWEHRDTTQLSNLLLAPNWALNSLASVGVVTARAQLSRLGSGWGPVIAVAALACTRLEVVAGEHSEVAVGDNGRAGNPLAHRGCGCAPADSRAPETRVHVPGHDRRAAGRSRGGARGAAPTSRDDHPLRRGGDRPGHEYRPPQGRRAAISRPSQVGTERPERRPRSLVGTRASDCRDLPAMAAISHRDHED